MWSVLIRSTAEENPGVLPDPSALRAAASALAQSAADVQQQRIDVATCAASTRWAAPYVDDVRRRLAGAEAEALGACFGFDAGAAHLRALAAAIEDLTAAAGRLRAAALEQARLAGSFATTPAQATALLDRVPDVLDPSWADRSGVGPVGLPGAGRQQPTAVPPSPPGLVEAELDDVRRLAGVAGSCSVGADTVRGRVQQRVGALGLALLDPYGLQGSRSQSWLASLADARSPLSRAGADWSTAATDARQLADLLAAADIGLELLASPRLGIAVTVFAAGQAGPVQLRDALQRLTPSERAWVAGVLPGRLQPAPSLPSPSGHGWLPGWVEAGSLLHELWRLTEEHMRRIGSWFERTPFGKALRWLGKPVAVMPVLRALSKFGVGGVLLGFALDLYSGVSLPLALSKAVAGLAAAAAVTAGIAALVGGSPVWLPAATVVATSVAAVVVAGAVGRYGPTLWSQAGRAGLGALRGLGQLGRGITGVTAPRGGRGWTSSGYPGHGSGQPSARRPAGASGRGAAPPSVGAAAATRRANRTGEPFDAVSRVTTIGP